MCGFSLAAMSPSGPPNCLFPSGCIQLCSFRVVGQTGRRTQEELLTVGLIWDSFCHPIGKKSKPVFSLIIFLCYFHIYFQQIETELRQMELIKDQYQKKNYEQVGDFHKLHVYHSHKISRLRFTNCFPLCAPPVTEYPEVRIRNE